MNKSELVDRLLFLGNTTEMCNSTDRHTAKELAHNLIDEYLEAINKALVSQQRELLQYFCNLINITHDTVDKDIEETIHSFNEQLNK